ncbi:MAG: hypothetical protein AAF211_04365, partial [Myxococcota bacterium]
MSVELPAWADELRNRYLAGEASMFMLHGNVRDLVAWREDGEVEWVDLRTFLERFLARTRDVITYYNVSQGLQFSDASHRHLFRSIVDARRQARGEDRLSRLPSSATDTIPVIEDLVSDPAHSSAVIVDYFEMIAPNADVAFMVHEDKANLVSLQRWSSDPAFMQTDNLVILVCEHLSDVSRRITSSSQLATIHLTFPDVETRSEFIRDQDLSEVDLEMGPEVLGKMTAGLSLVQIRNILKAAELTKEPITFGEVSLRKKAIIEQECHGLVEFIPPRHDFSHVGGMERIKRDLNKIADAVKAGNRHRVPMGMIFVGPMGTGKTFVA